MTGIPVEFSCFEYIHCQSIISMWYCHTAKNSALNACKQAVSFGHGSVIVLLTKANVLISADWFSPVQR